MMKTIDLSPCWVAFSFQSESLSGGIALIKLLDYIHHGIFLKNSYQINGSRIQK